MRKEMRIQRVQRGRVNSSIEITENEFESFLATDETHVMLEAELQVRQNLVKDKSTAEKILSLLKENDDFATFAKDYSISANANNGGLLDWRKPSEMPELFANALQDKPIGYVTNLLESGAGFHILKLENKRGDFVQFEDQWLVRHVLIASSAIRNDEETQQQLTNIRKRIIEGEDFSLLAEEFSEDPGSAKKGGDLGWTGLGVFTPIFEEMMLSSEIGDISEVFESEFGFHFLEVIDKRNYELTNDLIEDRAYNMLYARKYEEELENTLRTMRAEAFVEFKDLD
jgi:peptidyl-prolyl cis-trans isomerase SurA